MATQNSNQTQNQFGNITFREIHKNAWLKKVTSNVKKKREALWVVFCVHDDTDAFLEMYLSNKIAVLHKPDWFIHLNEVQHVSPTICPNEQEYEFVLTLKTEVVRLTAPTWDQMRDWVSSIQTKLQELRILSPKDNVYSKLPEVGRGPVVSTRSTRDPNSPLPPPPTSELEVLPGIEIEFSNSDSGRPLIRHWNRSLSQTNSSGEETPRLRRESSSEPEVFRFDNLFNAVQQINTETAACHYERLFQGDPGPSRQLERSSSALQQPPLSYKTFREQQVLQLQREMAHSGGVRLQLRKKDCINSVALADAFDSVWVCGWKQREQPMLYNVLHIGDKILSVAGIPVKSTAEANRILESHYCGLYVDIIIKRVPHGQVFLIQRETEGQSLGIVQENNTAVIELVEEDSLAARQGLSAKTKTCDGLSLTNWVLTEVNGRPLNLFFKKNQVRDRLNSVGRDISILVQPLDLIKQLKKELKALRNYKEYILQ
ncbi:uncharacterized protein LOC660694 isoform X1 [Tribolium castaneum]|uniref:PH domain-containing protein n=1 Tax=Tribolium castaneum TaxID=7070 RepID=D6W778_TRICA|nr:PREDICTED: uncharacterized protein LOC660694 isoform X1 [Tribolium castaneum]EFA11399.2 hypothetical protein TcasGA2_TC013572 [Tribolium castaneum]|eukprot:XP_967222.2 PREDICTED: uncharacterized protein LOC660694 isoform X1 [Tribolium castaneum]